MSAPLPPILPRNAWAEDNSTSLPSLPLKNGSNQTQLDKYREKIFSPRNSLKEETLPKDFLHKGQTAYKPLYLSILAQEQSNLKTKGIKFPQIKTPTKKTKAREDRILFSPNYNLLGLKEYLLSLKDVT